MTAIPADSLPAKPGAPLDLLDGVVVLDFTTSVAGPYAGQLLADLGATVVKIERPGSGDDSRAWGPPFLDGESLWFMSVNRNKNSVTLDFTDEKGYRLLQRLIKLADVILLNMVSRVQRKLGIDYETLCAVKPELVHVSITGFGLQGERANMPCYDLIAEGYSGVMDMTGEPDGPPQKVGTPAADLLAGEDAAMAAIAALFRQQRTGKGAEIDISMVESMTRFMSPRVVPYLGSGDLLRRSGGRDSVIAIYQTFDTADEPLTLGLGNDAIWKRFWSAVGDPEVSADTNYETNVQRREHRPVLVEKIAEVLKQKSRDEWLAIFAEARVPAGPIYRMDEIGGDIDLQRRGFLYQFERNGVKVPQIGLGIQFDGESGGAGKAPPKLGEDNRAILQGWLNLSDDEIGELHTSGII